jgi:hypothetical protein
MKLLNHTIAKPSTVCCVVFSIIRINPTLRPSQCLKLCSLQMKLQNNLSVCLLPTA